MLNYSKVNPITSTNTHLINQNSIRFEIVYIQYTTHTYIYNICIYGVHTFISVHPSVGVVTIREYPVNLYTERKLIIIMKIIYVQ